MCNCVNKNIGAVTLNRGFGRQNFAPINRPTNGLFDFAESDFFNEVFAQKADGTRALQVELQVNMNDAMMLAFALAAGISLGNLLKFK
jgi:hypothetical protein